LLLFLSREKVKRKLSREKVEKDFSKKENKRKISLKKNNHQPYGAKPHPNPLQRRGSRRFTKRH
jgi:hypothetical protein